MQPFKSATPAQLQIATIIKASWERRGIGPTQQEIADAIGKSKVTVHGHLCAMEKSGLVLPREKAHARCLRLTTLGKALAGAPQEDLLAKIASLEIKIEHLKAELARRAQDEKPVKAKRRISLHEVAKAPYDVMV